MTPLESRSDAVPRAEYERMKAHYIARTERLTARAEVAERRVAIASEALRRVARTGVPANEVTPRVARLIERAEAALAAIREEVR